MSEEETPVIRVKDLEKIYTGGVHAVKGVSFDVLPKKVVVIIGSSGSGKSTVLRCINRLIEPTKGEIFLEDVQINSSSTDINEIRSEIGMVFQSFELFMHLKVLDNVSLGLIKVRGYSKLDPELIGSVLESIKSLVAEGMTMVIVTHEIGFAKEVGDWVIYMDEGQVVESGTADIISNPKTERMKKFLGQILEP